MKITTRILWILSIFFLLGVYPHFADAAILSVEPNSTAIKVDSTVTIRIYVNTEGETINAAEGSLMFPIDRFNVVSIDTSGSLFSLWVKSPVYDGNRTISFTGGVPTPGYQGTNGLLFSVVLRAKEVGPAAITLLNGVVYSNDGKGSNVLRNVNNAIISVTSNVLQDLSPTPPPPPQTPTRSPAINIASPTHPSQKKWYSSDKAVINWELPEGVDSIKTILSTDEGATPTEVLDSTTTQAVFKNLEDGTWYFNLRAHTKDGWWKTHTYELHVDTTPPKLHGFNFKYEQNNRSLILTPAWPSDSEDTRELLLRDIAIDSLSGVSVFEIIIDDTIAAVIAPSEFSKNSYSIPITLKGGTHAVVLGVLDQAGNEVFSSAQNFDVQDSEKALGILERLSTTNNLSLCFILILTLLLLLLAMNIVMWRKLHRLDQLSKHK